MFVYIYIYICCGLTATILHGAKMASAREPFEFSLRSTSSEHYMERTKATVLPCPSTLIYAAKLGRQATILQLPGLFSAVSDKSVKRG